MSTKLGSSVHQTDSAVFYDGTQTFNQYARKLTMPAGGPYSIVTVGAWLAGHGSSASVKMVVWDFNSRAVLGQSAAFSAAGHAFAVGNSDSYERDLVTPITVAGGTSLLVGFADDETDDIQMDLEAGVTDYERLRSTWPGSMAGATTSSGAPQAWLYYNLANTLPAAPSLSAPANASRQITATPEFIFTHNDADSDPCASYDLQVSTDSTFASVTHWNDSNDTTGISGNTITRTYAGAAIARGTTLYWRCRTNDGVGDGTWSATRSFKYNALPTVTKNAPTDGTLAVIHNIGSDLAIWSGSEAKPQFKFTPSDADGDTMTKYQLRIYDAAAGGSMVYDSGEVSLSMTSGVLQTINSSFGIANDTERWWTITVYDGYEWATESTRTAFKMLWSQDVLEHDTGGTTSTNWSFSSGTTVETVSFLFSSSTGAGRTGTAGAWATSIGAVTPRRYMQVLVRMTSDTSGTPATLADATFSYYGTPSTPDGWTVS